MKKYALTVGVQEYRDQMIAPLNYARADAIAMAERLRGRCGFDQVQVLSDENGEGEPLLVNIVTALRDTVAELRPDDLFLFFFAGHGVEKDGHGYLLARDSLQAFPEHGSLSLELLRKTFESFRAGKRILLLDACRNDPDSARADADNCMGDVISRDIVAAARSGTAAGTTTALLSACRSGQRAYEWPAKGHGIFTHYLVEGLDGAAWEDRRLDFKCLAGYAAKRVRRWADNTPGLSIPQEPWYEEFGDPEPVLLATGEPGVLRPPVPANLPPHSEEPRPPRQEAGSQWWIVVDGNEQGPLAAAVVRERIQQGVVTHKTECWREGMAEWRPIGQMDEWFQALSRRVESPVVVKPPPRKPSSPLPDFLEAVPDAEYARLGGLNEGSDAAQRLQREWVDKGYPLEVEMAKTGMRFRLVPPGEFEMGLEDTSQHTVIMSRPIYAGKFPVTQQQWLTVMGKNPAGFQKGSTLPGKMFMVRRGFLGIGEKWDRTDDVPIKEDTREYPVENVSWSDCQDFLNSLHDYADVKFGKKIRLFTEAEWEYACRAGTSQGRYGELNKIAWYGKNSRSSTRPVGQKRPNAWGLHDMLGNVEEWCEDWYDSDYYAVSPKEDPTGPATGKNRVTRGGHWSSGRKSCRSVWRGRRRPGDRFHGLGLRVIVVLGDTSGQ